MKKNSLSFFFYSLLPILVLLSGCATWQGGNASLRNFRTIILDPGHGGFDHGARACRGWDEKSLNLDIAKRIKPYLEAQGYHVIMTRHRDVFIPLGTRARIANAHPDAVFISIHCNWATRKAAHGMETYYYNRKSEPFATQVLKETLPSYHAYSRGVKHARFYVLRHNERPATLIEVGFISNYRENRKLQNPHLRQLIAQDLARGILAHHPPLTSLQNSGTPAMTLAAQKSKSTTTPPSLPPSPTSSDIVVSSPKKTPLAEKKRTHLRSAAPQQKVTKGVSHTLTHGTNEKKPPTTGTTNISHLTHPSSTTKASHRYQVAQSSHNTPTHTSSKSVATHSTHPTHTTRAITPHDSSSISTKRSEQIGKTTRYHHPNPSPIKHTPPTIPHHSTTTKNQSAVTTHHIITSTPKKATQQSAASKNLKSISPKQTPSSFKKPQMRGEVVPT